MDTSMLVIMAMTIAHGGQSPCLISELLYDCLQRDPDNVPVKIEKKKDKTWSQLQSVSLPIHQLRNNIKS